VAYRSPARPLFLNMLVTNNISTVAYRSPARPLFWLNTN